VAVIGPIVIYDWIAAARSPIVATWVRKVMFQSNEEIVMILDAHPLYLLRARERGRPKVPWPLVGQRSDDGARVSTYTSETPDPAYWTPYDYHMMERDARARRRAHIYSMTATLGSRLWQLVRRMRRDS